MTLSYITGLTMGSMVSYIMEAFFGPAFQTKYLCQNSWKPSTTPITNTTINIVKNVMSSTLPTLEKSTALPKLKTTASILTTVLTSTMLTNSTIYTDLPTTISPKTLANVTTSVSNAIVQH